MVPVVLHAAGDSQPVPLRKGWKMIFLYSRNTICRFSGANQSYMVLSLRIQWQFNLQTKRWTKEELQIHSVDPGTEIEGSSLKWTDHSSTEKRVTGYTYNSRHCHLTGLNTTGPLLFAFERSATQKTKGEMSKKRKHKPASKGVSSPLCVCVIWSIFNQNISNIFTKTSETKFRRENESTPLCSRTVSLRQHHNGAQPEPLPGRYSLWLPVAKWWFQLGEHIVIIASFTLGTGWKLML